MYWILAVSYVPKTGWRWRQGFTCLVTWYCWVDLICYVPRFVGGNTATEKETDDWNNMYCMHMYMYIYICIYVSHIFSMLAHANVINVTHLRHIPVPVGAKQHSSMVGQRETQYTWSIQYILYDKLWCDIMIYCDFKCNIYYLYIYIYTLTSFHVSHRILLKITPWFFFLGSTQCPKGLAPSRRSGYHPSSYYVYKCQGCWGGRAPPPAGGWISYTLEPTAMGPVKRQEHDRFTKPPWGHVQNVYLQGCNAFIWLKNVEIRSGFSLFFYKQGLQGVQKMEWLLSLLLISLKLTVCTWKDGWNIHFPFGARPIFRSFAVNFRNYVSSHAIMYLYHQLSFSNSISSYNNIPSMDGISLRDPCISHLPKKPNIESCSGASCFALI